LEEDLVGDLAALAVSAVRQAAQAVLAVPPAVASCPGADFEEDLAEAGAEEGVGTVP